MPPQSSLPLRDGRVGSRPSSESSSIDTSNSHHEEYYSNQDIRLVYDIVQLAESIYPTLPERDRLPTNALFQAAEQVLPTYGLDPDHAPPHMSRLLFKVGGLRGRNSLGESFKAVLEGMGIELLFVPSSPLASSAGNASVASHDHGSHPSACLMPLPPSRRHSFDSQASRDMAFPTHAISLRRRPRSASSADADRRENEDLPRAIQPGNHRGTVTRESPSTVGETDSLQYSLGGYVRDAFPGESDTTVQSRDDVPRLPARDVLSPAELRLLEERLKRFVQGTCQTLRRDILGTWRNLATGARNGAACLAIASTLDHDDLVCDVLDVWDEVAAVARELRLAAEAAAESEAAYRMAMERRANRVYELVLINCLLLRWQERAVQELDRTAVARRHLVRKRAFDRWRAQFAEDEAKVTNFVLLHALQTWGQVALHHDIRAKVAARRHEQVLVNFSLHTLWQECKERDADELRYYTMVEDVLVHWHARATASATEQAIALVVDARLVLDEAVNIWLEEMEQLRYNAHEHAMESLSRDCSRSLDVWHQQARLVRCLRLYRQEYDGRAACRVLEKWLNHSRHASRDRNLADSYVLHEPTSFWNREAKLVRFKKRVVAETKTRLLHLWTCQERLAWSLRRSESRMKHVTLVMLRNAARRQRGHRAQAHRIADGHLILSTKAACVGKWYERVEMAWRHGYNASMVALYRTVKPKLQVWRERNQLQLVRSSFFGREADGNAAHDIMADVLVTWPKTMMTARKQRLLGLLRDYRSRYKEKLAEGCLLHWRSASREALDDGFCADDTHTNHDRREVSHMFTHWVLSATRAQDKKQAANEAETETYWTSWLTVCYQRQESSMDAIEHDEEKTARNALDRWDYQTTEAQGRLRMAIAFRDKTEQRRGGRLLDEWHLKANPDVAPGRMLSGRSLRRSLARSAANLPANQQANQQLGLEAFRSLPQPARARRPLLFGTSIDGPWLPRQLADLGTSFGAGPMAEFDEDSFSPDHETDEPGFMSTPTRLRGSTRPLPGYRPTSTPSAILPSPYERQLRQQLGEPRPASAFADIREESVEDA